MFATIASGHVDLADWLYLIAAVVFVVDAVLKLVGRPDPTRGALIPVGLALLAVAWLVL